MKFRSNIIMNFVDWLVPDSLRGDIADEKRVRMFIISHLMGPLLSHPITIFLLLSDPNPMPHVAILGISITLFWAFPIALKIWPKFYSALAFLSVQNLSFAILWGSYHYGGTQSPFLMWYLVLPLLAFFYLGSGVKTSIAIFAQITTGLAIFAAIYFLGGTYPVHIPLSDMGLVSLISTFSASTYVFFMASYYASVVDSQSKFLKEIARHQETLSKLTESKEDAERANGAKSDFLAKMSHELRTPLNAVLGYSEILLEDAELDGRGEDISDLQKISAAGKHLLSMVNDILDISKIEAGKTELYLEEMDFGKLIEEIEATSRPLAAKNTNKFTVKTGRNLGSIYVDGTKMRQAIYNLLSNSAKFTQSGEIILSAKRYKKDGDDRISISVSDNGVGISQKAQDALFSNFTQANSSITAKFGGTGLGLSLSQNLCQLMGGNITVESSEGEGSTFTIDLPAKVEQLGMDDLSLADLTDQSPDIVPVSDTAANYDEQALDEAIDDLGAMSAAYAGISSSEKRRPTKGKIVVIDDDPDFLEITERMLLKEGYSAISVNSPEASLQVVRAAQPVAVFVDVLMPNMDGWDVIKILKNDPVTSTIPVFMLSILEERQKGVEHNAADFITKPLDTNKLRLVLEKIEMMKSQATAQLEAG